ncbi:MarR family winged helix-turn-helix transcriptional regulator [Pseudomonas sp. MWU13-2105]|uniref:MarR family winged helix-turn-helix transcriptional regulator n=1 Tax=Pseudomonas sp. MWU13-2105 TaxID=2935074 RepID=UPI00200E6A10|nr:MarR family winged helix-turn-helix transcriptional regulator [Pseudomonas sp. MWU13-2105]
MKCAPPSPDDCQASSCANGAVRRASRRLGQIYDEAFAPCGLKATQYSLLSHIARAEQPKMRDLALCLVMDLSALGHTLKPLVRDGLVLVQVDELDRRSRRVLLTEDGRRKYEEARLISQRMSCRFEQAFGEEETVQLRKTLDFIASDDFARLLLGSD